MLSKLYEYLMIKIRNGVAKINVLQVKDKRHLKGATLKGAVLMGDVRLSEGVRIIDGVRVNAHTPFTMGRYSVLNGPNTDVQCKVHAVTIGAFTSVARNVSIQEYNHKIDTPSTFFLSKNVFKGGNKNDIYSKGPVNIGNDVWIGTQCIILSGVTIGDGAVIAANSVVTSNIPAYAIAGGTPAKVLRYRFTDDIISKLLALQWWTWPIDKIKANELFFGESLTDESFSRIK